MQKFKSALLAALVPLITTGGAITLRGVFPALDAGIAIFLAGFFAGLSVIWLAKERDSNGPHN